MSKWEKPATWLMLIIAFVVFLAAIFAFSSVIGRMYVFGLVELSIPQIGIICAGVTSLSVFVRCVKQLKRQSELTCT